MSGVLAEVIENIENRRDYALIRKNLTEGSVNEEYIIRDINTDDSELKNFLFSLGCYEGETVTIISILSDNYVISIKDARYSIDGDLASAIVI